MDRASPAAGGAGVADPHDSRFIEHAHKFIGAPTPRRAIAIRIGMTEQNETAYVPTRFGGRRKELKKRTHVDTGVNVHSTTTTTTTSTAFATIVNRIRDKFCHGRLLLADPSGHLKGALQRAYFRLGEWFRFFGSFAPPPLGLKIS